MALAVGFLAVIVQSILVIVQALVRPRKKQTAQELRATSKVKMISIVAQIALLMIHRTPSLAQGVLWNLLTHTAIRKESRVHDPKKTMESVLILTSSIVMRACDGCRRRKIKCDTATTNIWPCTACVRLKLHCVPPTLSYDRTYTGNDNLSELERVSNIDDSSDSGENVHGQHMNATQIFMLENFQGQRHVSQIPYNDALAVVHTTSYPSKARHRPAIACPSECWSQAILGFLIADLEWIAEIARSNAVKSNQTVRIASRTTVIARATLCG